MWDANNSFACWLFTFLKFNIIADRNSSSDRYNVFFLFSLNIDDLNYNQPLGIVGNMEQVENVLSLRAKYCFSVIKYSLSSDRASTLIKLYIRAKALQC